MNDWVVFGAVIVVGLGWAPILTRVYPNASPTRFAWAVYGGLFLLGVVSLLVGLASE